MNKIRNFCIIAHIDHGKSTLADRMLELTHTIEARKMKEQLLDQMDLERERGITIKLTPVRMRFGGYTLNLIDTPGHVDFAYEVSRSLAAVEGAVLLVDATQGIQAQTLSNLYLALEHNLEIIPVVNKIDLPAARPSEVGEEIIKLIGCKKEDIIFVSGKTGEGVDQLLSEIVAKIPSPKGNPDLAPKALVFDSIYNKYRGVVAYVRIMEGQIHPNQEILFMQTKKNCRVEEVGFFAPELKKHTHLSAGDIGYVVTGFKSVEQARVGDTITDAHKPTSSPLSGYKKMDPFVFASVFSSDGEEFNKLKEALEKLKLNDASLLFEPENSSVLGHGFRCGFLGLLHMDIVCQRLEREFDMDLVITSPSVIYKIISNSGEEIILEKANDLPEKSQYQKILEPWSKVEIVSPSEFIGTIMELVQFKRGEYLNTEYFEKDRVLLHFQIPLSELIIDFYDNLKSATKGYASLSYEFLNYREANLVRLDILVAEERIDALSFVVHQDKAFKEGKRITMKLKDLIPRQNFEIKLQAAIGGKIIAAERISPFRKDVTAKLYGGDVTRKNKLLDKQKKGKKRMKKMGKIDMPSDVFINVLRN